MIATLHDGAKIEVRVGQALMGYSFKTVELSNYDMYQLNLNDPRVKEWWMGSLALKFRPPMLSRVDAYVAELEPEARKLYELASSIYMVKADYDTLSEEFQLACTVIQEFEKRVIERR